MLRTFIRCVAGTAGVAIGLLSILVPLNFYIGLFSSVSVLPRQSQLNFWDGVTGSMIVLIFFAVFAFIAAVLIKFAFTRPESSSPDDGTDEESPHEHPVEP